MAKKGILAALIALLFGITAARAVQSSNEQKRGCCPACDPPETCCCK